MRNHRVKFKLKGREGEYFGYYSQDVTDEDCGEYIIAEIDGKQEHFKIYDVEYYYPVKSDETF